jgi:CRP-like cAMP-binding protein
MDTVKISKGSVLFAEGAEGDHLYVIVEGKLKLGTSSGDGRENLLSILGPGEMFGELSLFDPGPRTSTATAVTDAKLLSLAKIQMSHFNCWHVWLNAFVVQMKLLAT